MKCKYEAPVLFSEEIEFEAMFTAISENDPLWGKVKNGNGGNNQQCWDKNSKGDVFQWENHYYVCEYVI